MVEQALPILSKVPKSINIYLVSEGGEFSSALALHDLIYPIADSTIIAGGLCASAATLILQSANNRLATVNTQFIVHEVEHVVEDGNGYKGLTEEQKKEDVITPHLNRIQRSIMSKRIGFDSFVKAFDLKVFDARTALELNFIDGIIDPRPKGSWLRRMLKINPPDVLVENVSLV